MLTNSKSVAILIAATVSIITTAFLSLVENVPIEGLIVAFVLSLSSTYIITYFTVDIFIFGQIEKIHERISQLNNEKYNFIDDDFTKKKGNPLYRINSEIISYALSKQQEIDELKKAETFRREFIANISHELKTPIFASQGFIHTLLDGAVKDKNVRNKFLKKAAKNLDGLDRLVADLLIISQVETGVIKMEMENFNIHGLVHEVYEQLEQKAEKKKTELRIDANCPVDLIVFADRHKIYQVIQNLVSNAIKYRSDNHSYVMANFIDHGAEVEIIISDNGLGMAEEHISRIFERFYRIDKSRSKDKGGTGLGLSIVKHIIEAHHSHVRVKSKPGIGSEFSFRLLKGGLTK